MIAGIATVTMLGHRVTGPEAWTRDTVKSDDYLVSITPDARAELVAALAQLRANRLPTLLLSPADFDLDACRELMHEVRRRLDGPPMFAVFDRLPVGEMNADEATQLYWLLANLVARPVAQKIDGSIFYPVLDTGATLKPGSGIRPTLTNVDLTFHNDNSYNGTPPTYVCLLCLSKAKAGGLSRVMSMYSVHNELLERYPDLMPRLYRPFWYDRHREHEEGEVTYFSAPIFEYDGTKLLTRLALREIYAGYELCGEEMDEETKAALDAVQSVFDLPELRVELDFEPGQIQFVNNRATGHARTEFLDGERPEEKRHLVRLWLRETGKRGYRG
jgi:TfdA family taurine catabolism dioxygenase TauD